MNILDLIILAVLVSLALLGVIKGLLRLALGVGSLALAWWCATTFYRPLADGVLSGVGPGPTAEILAFALLFIGVVAGVALLARFLVGLLRVAQLRWMDRVAGGAVGLALAATLVAALVVPVTAILPAAHPVLEQSTLLPYVSALSRLIVPLVPDHVRRAYDERRFVGA